MRLIDVDALLEDLIFPTKQFEKCFKELMNDTPTVDAVEVVRCKNCIWYFSEQQLCGLSEDFYPDINDFCSRGKRRI